MGIRGMVAVGNLTSYKGVYNHWDSNPRSLGAQLFEHVIREMTVGQKTLAEIGEAILVFDDWRNYLRGGICEFCGKQASQPHSISGRIYTEERIDGVYPDPEQKHHEHEPLRSVQHMTNYDVKDSWLEWVYVINPELNTIHVLDVRGHCGKNRDLHVGDLVVEAGAVPPNFEVMECGANFERCNHLAYYHFPELADKPCGRTMTTDQYLGRASFTHPDDALAFLVNGERFENKGGGFHGSCAITDPSYRSKILGTGVDADAWYQNVAIKGNGNANGTEEAKYIPVAKYKTKRGTIGGVYKPYKGVTWVLPPTLMNPVETLKTR